MRKSDVALFLSTSCEVISLFAWFSHRGKSEGRSLAYICQEEQLQFFQLWVFFCLSFHIILVSLGSLGHLCPSELWMHHLFSCSFEYVKSGTHTTCTKLFTQCRFSGLQVSLYAFVSSRNFQNSLYSSSLMSFELQPPHGSPKNKLSRKMKKLELICSQKRHPQGAAVFRHTEGWVYKR